MSIEKQRRTHVIWSFDSSCLTDDLLKSFDTQKVDAVRIVAERGGMERVIQYVRRIRKEVSSAKDSVPVILDLFDHVRGVIADLSAARELAFGEQVTISPQRGRGDLVIRTDEWPSLFAPDRSVYLGNGMVALRVKSVSQDQAVLEVVQGGTIHPEADVQVPGTLKPFKAESIPDEVWKAATSPDLDYLILPPIEDPVELEKITRKLDAQTYCPWLLLKVSTRGTLEKLEELLPFVRGVMVSRVALSMQMDPAQIPMITKEIIQKCNDYAKISIVASEMLGSMRHNVTPTRAEVSDIANAVFDGADAIVLSEALAYGKYAVRGLTLASRAIEDAETSASTGSMNWVKKHPDITNEIEAVTYSAYRAAHRNQAKAIVCITKNGNTALHLASYGIRTPIIAVTLSPDVIRRLRLVRGVAGILMDESPDIDQVTSIINSLLIRKGGLKEGDRYVFVSVTLSSLGKEGSNLFSVQTVQ